MLADALRRHGAFFYNAEASLLKYDNDVTRLTNAMQEAGMSHGWVRLHSWNKSKAVPSVEAYQPTLTLVEGLKNAGIHVAGWGWNQGVDPRLDADVATEQLHRYGLEHYIADIEHGHSDAQWTKTSIRIFCKRLRQNLPTSAGVVVSTFGFVGSHAPELMQEAEPYVDAFAPQVYWFFHPKAWMKQRPELPAGAIYKTNDPASYLRLCIDMWAYYVSKPLIITGQAYWGESSAYTRTVAEGKLEAALHDFAQWDRIVGFNWWHLGHRNFDDANGAMSPRMFRAVRDAALDKKQYQQ